MVERKRRRLTPTVLWAAFTSAIAAIGLVASASGDLTTLVGYFPATKSFVEDQVDSIRKEFRIAGNEDAKRTQRALDQLWLEMLEGRIETLSANIESLENQYVVLDATEVKSDDLRVRLVNLKAKIESYKNMLLQHQQERQQLDQNLRERLASESE